MKRILIIGLIVGLFTEVGMARTIEVEVHGMTCSFCVDALQRKFKKVPHVTDVKVSLKLKKMRLETDNAQSPSIAEVKRTVLDSGFTPVKVEVLEKENAEK